MGKKRGFLKITANTKQLSLGINNLVHTNFRQKETLIGGIILDYRKIFL